MACAHYIAVLSLLISFASFTCAVPNRAGARLDLLDGSNSQDGFPEVLEVEHETIPLTFKSLVGRQINEDVTYAVNQTQAGFARMSRVGVTVQIGTSGTLSFDVRTRGVSSNRLSNSDSRFVSTLNDREREQYISRKRGFRGGLDVPFLRFIGINLSKRSSRSTMDRFASRTRNYNEKANAAKETLSEFSSSTVRINGTLTATGVSFTPVTAFAFIRVARVRLTDGTRFNVVTSNNGAAAATSDGSRVDSDGGDIDITDEDDFLFGERFQSK